jgi:hypothetical protein
MTTPSRSDLYLALIRERYHALERIAQELGAKGYRQREVVIVYYTGGERIEVLSNIFRDQHLDALIIQGRDNRGDYCEVIGYPDSLQLVLEVVPVEGEPRPKPSFVTGEQSH